MSSATMSRRFGRRTGGSSAAEEGAASETQAARKVLQRRRGAGCRGKVRDGMVMWGRRKRRIAFMGFRVAGGRTPPR